jgi:hypothetical protein
MTDFAYTGQTPGSGHWTLRDLLRPISLEEFRRDYWEHEILFLQRDEPGFFESLMTMENLDRILSESGAYVPEVGIVSGGSRQEIHDDCLRLETIYNYYRNGHTISMNLVHRRSEAVAALCRSMSNEIPAYLQVNAYLTPAGTQGFATHYDTHDVFVAQIYGSKLWRLYEGDRCLPEATEPWRPEVGKYGALKMTANLMAGDLLYLPRGTPHDAASNDCASLHLTIGVQPVTWASVIRDSVNDAIARNATYRTALPMGFAADDGLMHSVEVSLGQIMERLATDVSVGEIIERTTRDIRAQNVPPLRGHLVDLEALKSISLSTRVCQRPRLTWTLRGSESSVEIEFNGKVIRFPVRLMEGLRFIAETPTFSPRDLPGSLDKAGRLLLVSTLVREGFLSVRQC